MMISSYSLASRLSFLSFPLLPFLWFAAFLLSLGFFGMWSIESFAGTMFLILGLTYAGFAKWMEGEGAAVPALPKSPAFWLSWVFFGWALLSVLWSEAKTVTFLSAAQLSLLPLTYTIFILWDGGRGGRGWRALGAMLGLLLAGLGLWAAAQYVFLYDYFGGHARHPVGDPSTLGALFSLGLFGALGVILHPATTRAEKIAASLTGVCLIAGLYATAGRGPVFAMVPALIFMMAVLWPRVRAARRYLAALLAAAVILGAAVTVFTPGSNNMVKRVGETLTMEIAGGDVTNRRMPLWRAAAEIFAAHPALGTGYGTFAQYLPERLDPYDYPSTTFYAHNDPLQFGAELGAFGIALFYLLAAACLWRTLRALKNKADDKAGARTVLTASAAALLAFGIHSHVGFNLYVTPLLLAAGLAMAVWFVAGARLLQDERLAPVQAKEPFWTVKAALMLPFALIAAIVFILVAGEHFANRARDNLYAHQMNEFADNINKAGKVSQDMNYRAYILAVNVPLTILEAEKSRLDAPARRKLYDQATGYMNRVIAINPRVEEAYYYKAKVAEVAGEDAVPAAEADIKALYERALQINPLHVGARLSLLDIYRKEGRDVAGQIVFMEEILPMRFNSPSAMAYYMRLSALYNEASDYGKQSALEARIKAFQADVGARDALGEMGLWKALTRFDASLHNK